MTNFHGCIVLTLSLLLTISAAQKQPENLRSKIVEKKGTIQLWSKTNTKMGTLKRSADLTSGKTLILDDDASLHLTLEPLIDLFIKSAMSRFASIFAILYESGIPILEALNILSTTIGNSAISHEFGKIKEGVKEGRGISVPLKSSRFFPPMVVDMIAIGEGAGRLGEMLRDISSHYDEEVNYAIKRLSDSIGPVLTVGLAVIVGFFALAIFLPMWDLSKLAM